MVAPAELIQDVGDHPQQDLDPLAHGLRAAGQVRHQASADTVHGIDHSDQRSAQGGVRGMLDASGPEQFGQSGHLPVQHRAGALRGAVAGAHSGAAGGEDQLRASVQSLAEGYLEALQRAGVSLDIGRG